MDRIKFLKFFFYLTDVGPEKRARTHTCRDSHNRKPAGLTQGRTNLSDEEMFKYYAKDQIVEITGSRGTIFAVDTRGFHKGKPPFSG